MQQKVFRTVVVFLLALIIVLLSVIYNEVSKQPAPLKEKAKTNTV